MRARGWDYVDVVIVSGDAYVDHPSFGTAVIGRLLESEGLRKVVDFGEWWAERTGGLPLPLGGNIIRRDLGPELITRLSRLLHDSIAYGLTHREAAVTHAMQYGRGLDRSDTDTFVGMYVNHYTVDCGELVPVAAQKLLDLGYEAGIVPRRVNMEFIR